jgi:hypothetical protein
LIPPPSRKNLLSKIETSLIWKVALAKKLNKNRKKRMRKMRRS